MHKLTVFSSKSHGFLPVVASRVNIFETQTWHISFPPRGSRAFNPSSSPFPAAAHHPSASLEDLPTFLETTIVQDLSFNPVWKCYFLLTGILHCWPFFFLPDNAFGSMKLCSDTIIFKGQETGIHSPEWTESSHQGLTTIPLLSSQITLRVRKWHSWDIPP